MTSRAWSVQQAFAELDEAVLAADAAAGADPVARLSAVCTAYLRFAGDRPQRYRVLFGGVWNAAAALEEQARSPRATPPTWGGPRSAS